MHTVFVLIAHHPDHLGSVLTQPKEMECYVLIDVGLVSFANGVEAVQFRLEIRLILSIVQMARSCLQTLEIKINP